MLDFSEGRMEKLNVAESLEFGDFGKKESDSESEMIDFSEPKTETNIKTEEVAFCMTQGDLKAFTSKLEKNPCDEETAEVKTEKKWEPPHLFLTEVTDQFREEALERVCEFKREEK